MASEGMYEEIIKSLYDELEGTRSLEIEDIHLENTIAVQRQEETREYNERNQLYTKLLSRYINIYQEKEDEKKKYKKAFFRITMVIFSVIIFGCMYNILCISSTNVNGIVVIGVAGIDLAGIVSALIVLPKIIAEHLFPANEESNMIDMVKKMQDNDAKIRDVIFDSTRKNGDNER